MQRDKPINLISSIKSLQQLKKYLQQHNQQNLSILLDKNDNTLLNLAALKNDINRIKIYIKHYKQFTQVNHGTGLYSGQSTFIDKLKAWVNSPNKQGYIPLLYAAYHGNTQMIQFLQQCGSNMYYKTRKNQNVLFMCLQQNKIRSLIHFMESHHRYDVNQPNQAGDTILHVACQKGHTQFVSYLLTIGSYIQSSNNQKQTPLLVAARQQKKQVIKLLLIKGANRHATNAYGKTSLSVVQQKNNQDIAKILNDDYTCCDKVKIKCNKKIVYQPQSPSYLYSILFLLLFHLLFVPTHIYSQYVTEQIFTKYIPWIIQGLYYGFVILFYCLLLQKPIKKQQEKLNQIEGSFCAQCKTKLSQKTFHCYICARCINRYDHHCPWINNCVGAHNVGKFTVYLFLLIIGCIEVIFCNLCILVQPFHSIVRYREQQFNLPLSIKGPIIILTGILCIVLLIGLINLFTEQLRNLMTNTTGIERKKNKKVQKKKQLLASQVSQPSLQHIKQFQDQNQQHITCNCVNNCKIMLQDDQ